MRRIKADTEELENGPADLEINLDETHQVGVCLKNKMCMAEEKGVLVDALIEIENGETAKEKALAPSSYKGDNPVQYSGYASLSFLAICNRYSNQHRRNVSTIFLSPSQTHVPNFTT